MSNPTQSTAPAALSPSVGISLLPAPGPAAAPAAAEMPPAVDQPFSAFGSLNQFKDAQRMATMLTRSTIVPENYRGDEHLGDCVIALEIANRIGASILAVMQNLRLVQGKPGWSSQFLISCVNASKRFSPIRYQMTGTRGEDSWGCVAWAIDKTGELLKSPEVTIATAKNEGWYYRPGSKWKTLPELMLCYRSATLFARLYAPEITMGIQTTEEVVEMGPEGSGPPSRPIFESVSSQPESEPRSGAQPKEEVPIAPPNPGAAPTPQTGHYNFLKALTGLIGLSRHSEANVLTFLRNTRRCDESLAGLAEVADRQPGAIVWAHDNWKSVDRELTRLKQGKAI